MLVVLDTSALSATYRRSKRPPRTEEERAQEENKEWLREALQRLVKGSDNLLLPGIVLQEVLSGIRAVDTFDAVRSKLVRFEVGLADLDDHEEAARLFNACAAGGFAAGVVDCLIAAMTIRTGGKLLTGDGDFEEIAQHSSLELYPLTA